jgi:competence protein ComEA
MIKFNEFLALCTHRGQRFGESEKSRHCNIYRKLSNAIPIVFSVLMTASCEPVSTSGGKSAEEATPAILVRMDLNASDARELEKLSGIGSKSAAKIVEFRDRHGPFRRPEHLMLVDGISERKFLVIAPYIEVR